MQFGAQDAWVAMLYGETSVSAINALRSYHDRAAHLVTDATAQFHQQAIQAFNHFNGSAAIEFARSVVNSMAGASERPHVHLCFSEQDFKTAGPVMQRWLLADPALRTLYHQQRIDGWADTHVDPAPGIVGYGHIDYEMAVNRIVNIDDESRPLFVNISVDVPEGQRELTLGEQWDIQDSWKALRVLRAMNRDVDYTDPR